MSGPERTLERRFATWCKRNGYRCVKTQALGQMGFPDRTVFGKGRIAFVELKSPRGRPTAHQLEWVDYLQAEGHRAGIARTLDDAIRIVEG